jgi:hypothetical protein
VVTFKVFLWIFLSNLIDLCVSSWQQDRKSQLFEWYACRCTKESTQLDLSGCKSWIRVIEVLNDNHMLNSSLSLIWSVARCILFNIIIGNAEVNLPFTLELQLPWMVWECCAHPGICRSVLYMHEIWSGYECFCRCWSVLNWRVNMGLKGTDGRHCQ